MLSDLEHRSGGEGTTRSRFRATKTERGSPAPRKAKERVDLVNNPPRAAIVRKLPRVRLGSWHTWLVGQRLSADAG